MGAELVEVETEYACPPGKGLVALNLILSNEIPNGVFAT